MIRIGILVLGLAGLATGAHAECADLPSNRLLKLGLAEGATTTPIDWISPTRPYSHGAASIQTSWVDVERFVTTGHPEILDPGDAHGFAELRTQGAAGTSGLLDVAVDNPSGRYVVDCSVSDATPLIFELFGGPGATPQPVSPVEWDCGGEHFVSVVTLGAQARLRLRAAPSTPDSPPARTWRLRRCLFSPVP